MTLPHGLTNLYTKVWLIELMVTDHPFQTVTSNVSLPVSVTIGDGSLENIEKIRYKRKMIGTASHLKYAMHTSETNRSTYLSRLFLKEKSENLIAINTLLLTIR